MRVNKVGEFYMNSKEIAKLAGVSRSTVSRVVNNYSNVPEATRNRVLEVIKKYKYVPHASARVLAGLGSNIIGLFMVDKKNDTRGKKVSMSSYFLPFISGVIDSANKNNYHVLVSAVACADDYNRVQEVFYNKTISGGIFIGEQNDPEIEEFMKDGYKIVSIDNGMIQNRRPENGIIINADNFNGAYQATKYLISLGHTKIAHITGYAGQFSTVERLGGYQKALADSGINLDSALIGKGNYLRGGGYAATKKLLEESNPTAIFYANDSMAVGGMRAIFEKGMKVPDDISVVGFDDIEIASFLQPTLTTVRLPMETMSANAVNSLIHLMRSDTPYYASYVIPVNLILRQSCTAKK